MEQHVLMLLTLFIGTAHANVNECTSDEAGTNDMCVKVGGNSSFCTVEDDNCVYEFHKYLQSNSTIGFSEAFYECKNRGGTLAMPKHGAEFDFLKEKICDCTSFTHAWIGGELVNAKSAVWRESENLHFNKRRKCLRELVDESSGVTYEIFLQISVCSGHPNACQTTDGDFKWVDGTYVDTDLVWWGNGSGTTSLEKKMISGNNTIESCNLFGGKNTDPQYFICQKPKINGSPCAQSTCDVYMTGDECNLSCNNTVTATVSGVSSATAPTLFSKTDQSETWPISSTERQQTTPDNLEATHETTTEATQTSTTVNLQTTTAKHPERTGFTESTSHANVNECTSDNTGTNDMCVNVTWNSSFCTVEGNNCVYEYLRSGTFIGFSEAFYECKNRGGTLAMPKHGTEFDFFKEKICDCTSFTHAWIGACQTTDGDFKWADGTYVDTDLVWLGNGSGTTSLEKNMKSGNNTIESCRLFGGTHTTSRYFICQKPKIHGLPCAQSTCDVYMTGDECNLSCNNTVTSTVSGVSSATATTLYSKTDQSETSPISSTERQQTTPDNLEATYETTTEATQTSTTVHLQATTAKHPERTGFTGSTSQTTEYTASNPGISPTHSTQYHTETMRSTTISTTTAYQLETNGMAESTIESTQDTTHTAIATSATTFGATTNNEEPCICPYGPNIIFLMLNLLLILIATLVNVYFYKKSQSRVQPDDTMSLMVKNCAWECQNLSGVLPGIEYDDDTPLHAGNRSLVSLKSANLTINNESEKGSMKRETYDISNCVPNDLGESIFPILTPTENEKSQFFCNSNTGSTEHDTSRIYGMLNSTTEADFVNENVKNTIPANDSQRYFATNNSSTIDVNNKSKDQYEVGKEVTSTAEVEADSNQKHLQRQGNEGNVILPTGSSELRKLPSTPEKQNRLNRDRIEQTLEILQSPIKSKKRKRKKAQKLSYFEDNEPKGLEESSEKTAPSFNSSEEFMNNKVEASKDESNQTENRSLKEGPTSNSSLPIPPRSKHRKRKQKTKKVSGENDTLADIPKEEDTLKSGNNRAKFEEPLGTIPTETPAIPTRSKNRRAEKSKKSFSESYKAQTVFNDSMSEVAHTESGSKTDTKEALSVDQLNQALSENLETPNNSDEGLCRSNDEKATKSTEPPQDFPVSEARKSLKTRKIEISFNEEIVHTQPPEYADDLPITSRSMGGGDATERDDDFGEGTSQVESLFNKGAWQIEENESTEPYSIPMRSKKRKGKKNTKKSSGEDTEPAEKDMQVINELGTSQNMNRAQKTINEVAIIIEESESVEVPPIPIREKGEKNKNLADEVLNETQVSLEEHSYVETMGVIKHTEDRKNKKRSKSRDINSTKSNVVLPNNRRTQNNADKNTWGEKPTNVLESVEDMIKPEIRKSSKSRKSKRRKPRESFNDETKLIDEDESPESSINERIAEESAFSGKIEHEDFLENSAN